MPSRRLHFQDMDFERKLALRPDSQGHEFQWTPFSMPRIPESVLFTTFYLYRRSSNDEAIHGPCGTGVFVSRDSSEPSNPHIYAVTNYHVAVEHGASIIALNAWQDTSNINRFSSSGNHIRAIQRRRFLEYEPHEWQFIAGADDLAAVDVTDAIQRGNDLVWTVHENDFVTREFHESELSNGEDGFMAGLFVPSPGELSNIPTLRFGNVSRCVHSATLIKQGNGVSRHSHIFDIHSRPGFSGSPVFVFRTPGTDLTNLAGQKLTQTSPTKLTAFLRLLGIHSGQFLETIEAQKNESYGAPIVDGDKLEVPSSMTIVVPAWAISELIDLPTFKEQRAMREKIRC